jgi:signal peptidase II
MPGKRRKRAALIPVLCILSLLAIDQSFKALVHIRLKVGESIPIITGILHITFVTNKGAAFGLFKEATSIFIAISIVAVIFIAILISRSIKRGEFSSNTVFNYGLVFIVSGALGNLVDRLRFGYVIDFIDVRIWPVFNIADSAITIGTLLLVLSIKTLRFSH